MTKSERLKNLSLVEKLHTKYPGMGPYALLGKATQIILKDVSINDGQIHRDSMDLFVDRKKIQYQSDNDYPGMEITDRTFNSLFREGIRVFINALKSCI